MLKEFAYPEQTEVLRTVFSHDNSLSRLINEMRANYRREIASCKTMEEKSIKRESLSCVIWLAGSAWHKDDNRLKIDHEYFIETDDIGIGLSIHPEDSWKACAPFFHPHQTEIFIVVEGIIELECLVDGCLVTHCLGMGDRKVVPNGICHRIKFREPNADTASYFFIKTKLGQGAEKLSANKCSLGAKCPIQTSYEQEIAQISWRRAI